MLVNTNQIITTENSFINLSNVDMVTDNDDRSVTVLFAGGNEQDFEGEEAKQIIEQFEAAQKISADYQTAIEIFTRDILVRSGTPYDAAGGPA